MTNLTSPQSSDQPDGQANMRPLTPDTGITSPPAVRPEDPALTELPGPATPARHASARAWAVGGVALVVALGVFGAVIAASRDEPTTTAAAMTFVSPSTIASTTSAPTSAAPSTAAPTSAAPSPTRTTQPPRPKPSPYKTLSARQWKLIAKNPDKYLGKNYVVYGRVTQFDAATGTDTFRADVAHRRMADEWDYETNTMLSGSELDLEDLVEDDIFRAKVTVLGSFSYDTQIGGQTTVPLLHVDSIKVL